jgi:ATP-dependent RNA helicase RhlE
VFEQFIVRLPDRIKSLAVFGGVAINPQMQALRNVDILIATPGRLIELEEKNAVKLSAVSTLVLDEADKMLNLGFKEEIDTILALLPASGNRQNLLFSATLSDDLHAVNQLVLNSPTVIKIASADDHIDLIKQRAYLVETEKKGPFLRHLIKSENLKQTLIFTSSAYQADHIADKLRRNKIQAESIHGKLSQGARTERLADFKAGKLRILVATDLLARGVDITALPCVINYELPRSPKDYIHRIGRTGRAETPGQAISLISPEECHHFKVIQKKMGKWLTLEHTEGIEF